MSVNKEKQQQLRKTHSPLIVALDVNDLERARSLVQSLHPYVSYFKIGLELFTVAGPRAIEVVRKAGGRVFLDLKYHDIPHTVQKAVTAAARLGVDMLTVHTWGGRTMLEAAVAAAAQFPHPPVLLGVTVLTSLDAAAVQEELHVQVPLVQQVTHLAHLARDCGLQGIVASPLEVETLRKVLGNEFLIITPGVRPTRAASQDQRRVASPRQAIASGSDYLVMGRTITQASDPEAVVRQVLAEIQEIERS